MREKWNPKESLRRAKFIAAYLGESNGKLLDIGSYKGELRRFLPKVEYYPLDVYDLKKRFKNAVVQNLNEDEELPFKNEFFDYIVCAGTLEHLFHPDKIMEEIRRVLKDKGIAIISLPNDNSFYLKFMHLFNDLDIKFEDLRYLHHWFFGLESIRDFIGRYFTILDERGYSGLYGRFLLLHKSARLSSELFYKVIK